MALEEEIHCMFAHPTVVMNRDIISGAGWEVLLVSGIAIHHV